MPAEVSLTLEEAKTAIRAAGGDVIQVGFLARAYLRQGEEEPESAETDAARQNLCQLVAQRLKDRKLLAPEGRFELLEEPAATFGGRWGESEYFFTPIALGPVPAGTAIPVGLAPASPPNQANWHVETVLNWPLAP